MVTITLFKDANYLLMNNRKKIFFVVSTIILLIAGISLARLGFQEISRAQSSCGDYGFINSRCSELPTIAEAENTLRRYSSKVNQIKNVNPGFIDVLVQESDNCTGKGIISISHPSESDCESLIEVLDKSFYGIPYKIVNN